MHRVLPAFVRVWFAAGVSFRAVWNCRVVLDDRDLGSVVEIKFHSLRDFAERAIIHPVASPRAT
jgi:hypothetical protein